MGTLDEINRVITKEHTVQTALKRTAQVLVAEIDPPFVDAFGDVFAHLMREASCDHVLITESR